jgi:uncharacterized membrane protein YfcA
VTTLALVALAGLAGGVLAGLFGVGGGIVFVPTLALGLGLTQLEAEATSLLAILPTVAAGGWRQHRYGNVDWHAALVLGTVGVAGVQGGVWLAHAIPETELRRLFGVLMILVAAQVAVRALRRDNGPERDQGRDRARARRRRLDVRRRRS